MTPDRRQAVLEAATEIFSQHGFKKASLSDIAEAAGVSKTAIYLVADSKADLYFEILQDRISSCTAQVAQAIRVDIPADQQLPAALQLELSHLHDDPLIRALLIDRAQSRTPAWRTRFEELRRLGRSTTTRLIELGIRQGRFRADLDADAVAALLQDLQVAALLLADDDGDVTRPRWQTTLTLFLDGLKVR
jgi:AcrR family transcriptional regulator